eukprot:Partr_v1_DN28799_c0_g1_i4_m63391 putative inositol
MKTGNTIIQLVTFNTAGLLDPPKSFVEIIRHTQSPSAPDIVAVCLQEVGLGVESLLIPPPGLCNSSPMVSWIVWIYGMYESLISSFLIPLLSPFPPLQRLWSGLMVPMSNCRQVTDSYALKWQAVVSDSLSAVYDKAEMFESFDYIAYGSCMLLLFSRRPLDIRSRDVLGTGLAGVLPNKGGVAVDLGLPAGGGVLRLVAVHMAAHEGRLRERNRDFKLLTTELMAHSPIGAVCTVFMGDMNYRLRTSHAQFHAELAPDGIISHGRALELDELSAQLESNPDMRMFRECSKVEFPFSYKFKVTGRYEGISAFQLQGDDMSLQLYDMRKRLPAWCDRILYGSSSGSDCTCLKYGSISVDSLSDHYPVGASLSIAPSSSGDTVKVKQSGLRLRSWTRRAIPFLVSLAVVQAGRMLAMVMLPVSMAWLILQHHLRNDTPR